MPIKPTYPGVYIQEERSGVHAIAGVATSVAAFFSTAPKGPIGVPQRVFSYANFTDQFGTGNDYGELPIQVRQFFMNGGSTAWITRLALNADRATAVLTSAIAGKTAMTVTAKDAGVTGNTIQVEVDYKTANPERYFNLTLYRRVIDAKGKEIISDQESFSGLSLDNRNASFVETAVNANSKLVDIAVHSDVTGNPAAVANDVGSLSGWLFTGGSQAAAEGNVLTTITKVLTGPAPKSGMLNISLDGKPAVPVLIKGAANWAAFKANAELAVSQQLGLANAVSIDVVLPDAQVAILKIASTYGAVVITSAATSDIAAQLKLGVANGGIETDRTSALRPVPTALSARLHTAANADFALLAPLFQLVANKLKRWQLTDATGNFVAGADLPYGANVLSTSAAPSYPAGFAVAGSFDELKSNLTLLANDVTTTTLKAWKGEMQGLTLVITPASHDPLVGIGAAFATVAVGGTNLAAAGGIFDPGKNPDNVAAYRLGYTPLTAVTIRGDFNAGGTPGSDGSLPDPATYAAGYDALIHEADIFNIVVLPRCQIGSARQTDSDRANLWGQASVICLDHRAFLIMDPPGDTPTTWNSANAVDAGILAQRVGVVGDHAAIYWPRLKVSDDQGKDQVIDPGGTIAGLYARTDNDRGVWKAPAGIGATLSGVRGLQYKITDVENGITNLDAVNTNRLFAQGIVSWGSRTLAGFENSGEDDWRYVPVRRLGLFIEESLYRGLKFAVFEPNDEPLWAQIRLAAGAFMNNLFRQGAFKGSKSSDAYFVACDSTTTTQNDINLGIVNVKVGFAPLKPAEFVIVTIRQLAGQIDV